MGAGRCGNIVQPSKKKKNIVLVQGEIKICLKI